MYQNYNNYPQQSYQPQQQYLRQAPPQQFLKGRLVSSLEEARATSIDFDGSVFYFPDLANKRIYTKQINMDGTATLCMYELKALPTENNMTVNQSLDNFVTKDELAQVVAQLRDSLGKPTAVPAPAKQEVLSF